jgi:hypothetical protein
MKSNDTQGGAVNPKYVAGLKKVSVSHTSCHVLKGLAQAVSIITKQKKYQYPVCCLYQPAIYLMTVGMMEGSGKYGRHNFRIAGAVADTYYGATSRHVDDWWSGKDIDPHAKGNLHHIAKAMSSLQVILDVREGGVLVDDRPPHIKQDFGVLETKYPVGKKVKASTCYAEIKYHLEAWWEGEDVDRRVEMGGLHHLYLALAWMHELLKAILEETIIDDRPPRPRNEQWMEEDNARAVELLEARKGEPPAAPFTQKWVEDQEAEGVRSVVVPTITQLIPKPRRMTVKPPQKRS